MDSLGTINNLDLLSVGIATAAIGILGFAVFSSDRKSITNKSFLYFSLITILWGVFNYVAYQDVSPNLSLVFFRIVIALATWHAFFIFQIFYVFPKSNVIFPRWYKFGIFPLAVFISFLTLTPLVFKRVAEISETGQIGKIENAPGIALFGIFILSLILSSIGMLLYKTVKARGQERNQFKFVLIGTLATFTLLLIFNFILPAFFANPNFISMGPVFIFPFIAFTYYAILKYRLLKIKVLATELITLVLAVTTFMEIIFSDKAEVLIFRIGVFLLVLSFSVLLIKSVRNEIQQREKLEKLTKELESTNVELKKLDEFRRQILSFASHDLKAPISLMKQSATLIFDGTYKDEQKIKDTALKIKMFADRGINMIDNFLDIRKMEEGKLEYNFEKKNFAEFSKNITGDFALLAKQRDIEVTFESPVENVEVEIDTDKMRQVLQNLLENSLKYTEAGSVHVTLIEEQTTVLVKIQDTGIGMTKDLLPTLFEQFKRGVEVKKTIKGTGLGLYISKQIVLAHHGEIWAESEGVGKGSQFFVRLKKA